jgi:hypothetical protein
MNIRILYLLLSAAAGAVTACYGQPLVHDNSDLVLIVITVFSVFGGFLIAIITVLGDPALIPAGSWRIVESRRDNIQNRIIWHSWLFVLYLITIALLFAAALLSKTTGPHTIIIRTWIERGYLFLAVFSFLLSFALPWSLMKLQHARVDAELKKRRAEDGIPDETPPAKHDD